MSAKIIPFPERPKPPPEQTALVRLAFSGMESAERVCDEVVHYFASREETCQCGKERWPKSKRRFFFRQ